MNISVEIQRRIEECQTGKSQELDLSNCNLTEVPRSICDLHHVQTLDLSGNRLSSLPANFAYLYNLSALELEENRFDSVPEVLCFMTDLAYLGLGSNQIEAIPDNFYHLHKLEVLDLSCNQLTEFPEVITLLHRLRVLTLDENLIENLPDSVLNLTNLETLDLSYNRISYFSESIAKLPGYLELILVDNPFVSPPEEIAVNGIEAIRNYFAELAYDNQHITLSDDTELEPEPLDIEYYFNLADENYYYDFSNDTDRYAEKSNKIEQETSNLISTNSAYLFEAKLLIVGEGRVGKTSLAKSLQNPEYILQDEASTRGIDIHTWILSKQETGLSQDFRFNLWDFAGQEINHQIHQFFLTKRSLYLFVTESQKEDKHDDFFYWLNIIQLLGHDSPVILVLNKCDESTKALPINEYQNAFPNLIDFHKVSCHPAYRHTLTSLREAIIRIITNANLMPHVGSKLPSIWVRIREEITEIRASGKDFISRIEYLELCGKYEMDEARADFLSDFFHDIGVFSYFKDDFALRETIFLNFEWITTGVYRVLDSERVMNQKGKITDADLVYLWSEAKYKHKHIELRALMMNRKFELLYELSSGGYLVPQLLPVDEIAYEWRSVKENLFFEFRYRFMPKGMLTRFIVKRHIDIYEETHWRYGVLLEWQNTRAIVRERYFERKISIQIEGPSQREMLDIIRKTFDEIHSSYKNIEVFEMIPCNCLECNNGTNPHFFDFNTLRRFLKKGKQEVTCEKSVEDVDIRTLLSEIVLPERERRRIHYHVGGDFIKGDKVGGDKIDAEIDSSENVAIGKKSSVAVGE